MGTQLTSPEDYTLLNQLTDMLLENGWFVSHVEIDKVRDVFLHIVGGGEFKATLTQDPEITVSNLNVVLTSEEFKDVQPGGFQYIDLRFGNKVFVNENLPTEDEEIDTEFISELEDVLEAVQGTETATSNDATDEE
jgi:hypothetical protein